MCKEVKHLLRDVDRGRKSDLLDEESGDIMFGECIVRGTVALWHLPLLPHLHIVLEITIAVFAAPLIGVANAWSVECHSEGTENIL